MNDAENLLECVRMLSRKDELICAQGIDDLGFASFVALALRFERASKALQLRAMYEGWSQQRIVQELY